MSGTASHLHSILRVPLLVWRTARQWQGMVSSDTRELVIGPQVEPLMRSVHKIHEKTPRATSAQPSQ